MSARHALGLGLLLGALSSATLAGAQEAPPPLPATPEPNSPGVAADTDASRDAGSSAPTAAITQPAPVEAPSEVQEAPAELTAAELAELGLSKVGSAGAPPVDTAIKISGFLDFTFSVFSAPSDSFFLARNRHPTFYIGNANLYVSKNITESIRTFLEVRLSYLPNGAATPGSLDGSTTSTAVPDYLDASRPQRWGGIVMQRAYLEWAMHEKAVLRVGQFLTPYGIWNVDHGSPTIISVLRPYIVGAQLFPERQTGMQLFGRARAGMHHAFSYALTLSNGFGPVSEYRDLDSNKAVGGRLDWTYDKWGELRLGGSAFYGYDTTATDILLFKPSGELGSRERIDRQSRVLSFAGDLRWTYQGLLLQGELITQQRQFTSEGRVGAPNIAVGNQYLAPKDALSWGWYALAGYRFPWLGVMPYLMYTYNKIYELSTNSDSPGSATILGLNIRAIDAVVLKLEYVSLKLKGKYAVSDDRLHVFNAQLAWAF